MNNRLNDTMFNNYAKYGLTQNHLNNLRYDEQEHGNYYQIHKLMDFLFEKKKFTPEEVIREANDLSFFQMKSLTALYDQGLRADHLRAWKSQGKKFTLRHDNTLQWLIHDKHCKPELAVQALSGDDMNFDEMQKSSFAAYLKLIEENKLRTADDRVNVVVGLGPAGLASVLELVRNDSKKRKVIAFTNRLDYTRRQVLKVEKEDYAYLSALTSSEKLEKLVHENKLTFDRDRIRNHDVVSFKTRESEDLLFSELAQFQQNGVLEIINISDDPQSKIAGIDKYSHKLILENGREIPFDIFVTADGAKHDMANQCWDMEEMCVEFFPTQKSQLINTHAVVNFKLPGSESERVAVTNEYRNQLPHKEDVITADRIPEATNDVLQSLRAMGWRLQSLPEIRIFCIDGTLYIAGECPPAMCGSAENRERWMREVLKSYLPQKYIDKLIVHYDVHHEPDSQTFKTAMVEAGKPVYRFPKLYGNASIMRHSARMVMIGDGLKIPHYLTGTGALLGLREAKAFGEFLQTSQHKSGWDAFVYQLNQLRDANRARIDGFLDMRLAREEKASSGQKRELDDEPSFREYKRSRIDEAYRAMKINPNPLYVCDPNDTLPRYRALLGKIKEDAGLVDGEVNEWMDWEDDEVIRDDLNASIFRRTASIMCDYTSSLHVPGTTVCPQVDSGITNHLSLSFVTKNNDNEGDGKTYHFYRFRLRGSRDNLRIEEASCVQLVIYEDGGAALKIPTLLEDLHRAVRGRFNLNVRKPATIDDLKNQYAKFDKEFYENVTDSDAKSVYDGDGEFWYLKIPREKLDAVLKSMHSLSCTNQNSTVEKFAEYIKGKLPKQSQQGFFGQHQVQSVTEPPKKFVM